MRWRVLRCGGRPSAGSNWKHALERLRRSAIDALGPGPPQLDDLGIASGALSKGLGSQIVASRRRRRSKARQMKSAGPTL